MSHGTFLQDLSVVIMSAAAVTIIFRQLKLPIVLGYILAGFLIGPHFLPISFIKDQDTINTLSELGIIFLMFSLGLEFSLRKLKDVGPTAFLGAILEIITMGWIGYHIGLAFSWNKVDSIFLGALLAMSSTTIIIKALDELGKSKERFAELVFGILIVEDILGILILALISSYHSSGSLDPGAIKDTVINLSCFLGVILILGLILVPRLLDYVAKFKSNEMMLLTVVGLCFGICLLAQLLEYSVALGAFLIGAVIAEARQIVKIEALTHPVRDLFSAVFFVSIGLLINPTQILQYWAPILVITLAVVIGKVIACSVGTFIAGNSTRTSMKTGMTLAQIGEFSFIIASLGLSLKMTSDFIYPIAVAVSAITTLLTPFLIKLSDPMVNTMERIFPASVFRGLDGYTNWVETLSSRRGGSIGMTLLKKWGWQIGLNLLLITAAFIGMAALRSKAFEYWPTAPGGMEGIKAILWLSAMVICLPMFIAVFRKLQAAGMLVSEMTVTKANCDQKNTGPLRNLVSLTVVALGTAGLALVVLMLSSAILPSWNILIVLALMLVVAVIILRRSFVRVYSKAQIALAETFAQQPDHHDDGHGHGRGAPPLPAMLHDAKLINVVIAESSYAVGKLIAELQLRSKTGASIVGIERAGTNIVNPGPDEEIQAGDQVLLLGTEPQLAASEVLLGVKPA